jgi:hypothetical protein
MESVDSRPRRYLTMPGFAPRLIFGTRSYFPSGNRAFPEGARRHCPILVPPHISFSAEAHVAEGHDHVPLVVPRTPSTARGSNLEVSCGLRVSTTLDRPCPRNPHLAVRAAVIYGNHLSSLLPATPFGPSSKYPKRGLGGKPLSFVLNLALPRSVREDSVSGNVDAAPPKRAKSVVKFEKQSPTRHFRQRIQITTAADYLLWLLSSLSNGGGRTSGAGIVREGARLNN